MYVRSAVVSVGWRAIARRVQTGSATGTQGFESFGLPSDADKDWGRRCYTPVMTLKNAAFFAFLGMALLTVMLAVVFIRDLSSLLAGAIALISVLAALIRFLASLSVAVFLYVFYRAQS